MAERDPTSSRTPAKKKSESSCETRSVSQRDKGDLNLQQSLRTPTSRRPERSIQKKKNLRVQTIDMFSPSSSCRVTAACVVAMMMMMMMMKAEAMPKAGAQSRHSVRSHRKSSDAAELETVPLQLDPNTFAHTRNIRPLQNASISPWTYNVSHDDSLFPPMLSEARCLLHGCLDSEGQEDVSLESRPIMHQVLMLRRVRTAGDGYHYRLESRLIAVGCTCVRPMVQQQQ